MRQVSPPPQLYLAGYHGGIWVFLNYYKTNYLYRVYVNLLIHPGFLKCVSLFIHCKFLKHFFHVQKDVPTAHIRSSQHDPHYGYGYIFSSYLFPYHHYPPPPSFGYVPLPTRLHPHLYGRYGPIYHTPSRNARHSQLSSPLTSYSNSNRSMESEGERDNKCE